MQSYGFSRTCERIGHVIYGRRIGIEHLCHFFLDIIGEQAKVQHQGCGDWLTWKFDPSFCRMCLRCGILSDGAYVGTMPGSLYCMGCLVQCFQCDTLMPNGASTRRRPIECRKCRRYNYRLSREASISKASTLKKSCTCTSCPLHIRRLKPSLEEPLRRRRINKR